MKKFYILASMLLAGFNFSALAQTYASIPYTTGFESGSMDASWAAISSDVNGEIWVSPLITSTWGDATPHTGTYFLGMHQSAAGGGVYNENQGQLHLDLSTGSQFEFEFWWAEFNDETEVQDGVFFSDDGGATFVKVVDLDGAAATDLLWYQYTYDLDSMVAANGMVMTSTFVISFNQYDNYYMAGGNDGFLFDDISITIPGGGGCTNSASSFTQSSCFSYIVPSGDETYTVSGIYNDTIPNVGGCDSVMTIDVSINTATASSVTLSACSSYTVPSGDETYTASGIYNDTIFNVGGCDSVMTIDVTINGVSYSTSQSGNDLSVIATSATYQWVDCDNGNAPISGATAATYTATTNGNYAVEVTQNGCTETSSCMNVAGIGFEEEDGNAFNLYPNPNHGSFFVEVGEADVDLRIYNATGQLIYSVDGVSNVVKFDLGTIPPGIYVLRLDTELDDRKTTFVIE